MARCENASNISCFGAFNFFLQRQPVGSMKETKQNVTAPVIGGPQSLSGYAPRPAGVLTHIAAKLVKYFFRPQHITNRTIQLMVGRQFGNVAILQFPPMTALRPPFGHCVRFRPFLKADMILLWRIVT